MDWEAEAERLAVLVTERTKERDAAVARVEAAQLPPDLDLDAIEARANAATLGPWRWGHTTRGSHRLTLLSALDQDLIGARLRDGSAEGVTVDDSEFIAHAREDVPALVQAVRALGVRLVEAERREQKVRELHPSNLTTGVGHYCMVPGDDRPRYFCDGRPCPTLEALGDR